MITNKLNIGYMLSQRGLSVRLNRDVSTIRRAGERVSSFLSNDSGGWVEVWERNRFQNDQLHGYKLVEIVDT